MQILGKVGETFLFLNGLKVHRPLSLGDSVELLPAQCSPDPDAIITISNSEVELGITTIFLRQVCSQLRVTEKDPKKHAALAWNSIWDAVLLSAIFDCEVVCNFQSDRPAEEFGKESNLQVTNFHLRGLTNTPRQLDEEEAKWITSNFTGARDLIKVPEFQNAVHCMATYRWHTLPRARLALIWAGIEGLFNIESEVLFRLSLYISRFLEPTGGRVCLDS